MKIKYDIRHNKTVGANVYFNVDEFILFYKILSDFVHPELPDAADLKLGKEMYDGILTPEEYKQELKGEQRMKLIIDTDESTYKRLKEYYDAGNYGPVSEFAIANGTPLEEELEKIKARLNHRANEHLDGDYYVRIRDINEVIDEELAKLKGEYDG